MIGKTNCKPKSLEIVSWGGGTIQQISKMLDAHYSGKIDISDYWAVGDSRNVSITQASGTTTVSGGSIVYISTQAAQDVDVIIMGFDHDNLSTPINGKSKAAVSVGLKNCLSNPSEVDTSITAGSIMWSTCAARYWCNSNFFNSLPSELSKIIKPVTKLTNQYGDKYKSSYTNQETTTDKVFLLSCSETYEYPLDIKTLGGNKGLDPDGSLYEYMKTEGNRYKSISGYVTSTWWMRSSYVVEESGAYVEFGYTNSRTGVGVDNANCDNYGISPAFCL